MRPALTLFLFIAIAACSSPSIQYREPPTRVKVEGWTIDVYRNGLEVQAIRLNSVWRPRGRDMLARGIRAIEQSTGCTVLRDTVEGDAALINALIEC